MENTSPEYAPAVEVPTSREEMDGLLDDLSLERDKTVRNSIHNRQAAVEALQNAGANGDAEHIADILPKVDEQLATKEAFRNNMEVAETQEKGLFRRAYETIKAHPYLTAAAIIAIVTAGVAGSIYLAGGVGAIAAAVEKAAAYVGLEHLYGAGEVAGGAAKAAESLGEAVRTIPGGIPDYVSGPGMENFL